MNNDYDFKKRWRLPLIITFAVLVLGSAILIFYVVYYNSREMLVNRETHEIEVYVQMDINDSKGERWNSTMQVSDNPQDTRLFTGETVTCTIRNDNNYKIKKWKLKISPGGECYLNGFWGGSVEVHQFRGGEEIVETLDGIVAVSDIQRLDNNPYPNAMMIRFCPGDYLVYTPSVEKSVDYIWAKNVVGVVFNFYYIQPLNFSEYELTYRNDLKIGNLWETKLLTLFWAMWVVGMIFYHAVVLVNNRILRDTKNRDQSISAMADLYLETYRVNPQKGTAFLIRRKQDTPMLVLENGKLQKNLFRYIDKDCTEVYADDLKRFFDLSTLDERMQDVTSIVYEYKSRTIGWCALRFIKLANDAGGNEYVLTFQDINEERQKMYMYEEHIRAAENATLLQGSFIDTTVLALNGIGAGIQGNMKSLEMTLTDEQQKILAKAVQDDIDHQRLLSNFVYDLFALETDRFQLREETYNVQDMVKKLQSMLKPFQIDKEFEFKVSVDDWIPMKLKGDRERLMQILVVLLSSCMLLTKEGSVKLTVNGKQKGDNTEVLMFSVQDSTEGFKEEQLAEIHQLMNNLNMQPAGNASYTYFQVMNQILRKMNSELRLVSTYGRGSDFFFTIEQEIVV